MCALEYPLTHFCCVQSEPLQHCALQCQWCTSTVCLKQNTHNPTNLTQTSNVEPNALKMQANHPLHLKHTRWKITLLRACIAHAHVCSNVLHSRKCTSAVIATLRSDPNGDLATQNESRMPPTQSTMGNCANHKQRAGKMASARCDTCCDTADN